MLPDFEEGGASLIAITPQVPAISAEQLAERKLRIPLLTDAENGLARALGLVWTLPEDLREIYLGFGIDLAAANGDDSWTLPMPARYVVGADGVIIDASIHPDYTTRPEPGETLDIVLELSA